MVLLSKEESRDHECASCWSDQIKHRPTEFGLRHKSKSYSCCYFFRRKARRLTSQLQVGKELLP